jgi:hypothetical protein
MRPSITRRRALHLCSLGLLGSLAGCGGSGESDPSASGTVTGDAHRSDPATTRGSDGGGTPTPEDRRTTTPEDRRTSTPGVRRVTGVSDPGVQTGVVRLNVDALGVDDDDPQYLLVRVAVPDDGRGPDRDAFVFVFDGLRYAPHPATENVYARGGVEGYTAEDGGWLVFGLPATGAPNEMGLRWPDRGSWIPPQSVRERLASPTPSFAVAFDVPETPTAGDPPTLSVTAENTGENPGQCVLSLTRSGPEFQSVPVRRFAFDLGAGESATRTHEGKLPERGSDPQEVVYTLDRPGGDALVRELAPADVQTTASEAE